MFYIGVIFVLFDFVIRIEIQIIQIMYGQHIHTTKNKGTLVVLLLLGVALQEELQQILRAETRHILFRMPDKSHQIYT